MTVRQWNGTRLQARGTGEVAVREGVRVDRVLTPASMRRQPLQCDLAFESFTVQHAIQNRPSLGLRDVELKNIAVLPCFYTDFRTLRRLALKRLVVLQRGSSHLTVTVGIESVS